MTTDHEAALAALAELEQLHAHEDDWEAPYTADMVAMTDQVLADSLGAETAALMADLLRNMTMQEGPLDTLTMLFDILAAAPNIEQQEAFINGMGATVARESMAQAARATGHTIPHAWEVHTQ